MKTMFISDISLENFSNRTLTRERAKGYKNLVIDDDVNSQDYVEIVSKDNNLVMKKVNPDENDAEEVYMILTKEFGLFGGIKSTVDIIHLDNGYMLVTLYKGALVITLDGKPCIPNVAQKNFPDFTMNEVFWVNQEYLLSYSKYYGDKGFFLYDFILQAEVSGAVKNNNSSFTYRRLEAQDKDISLGAYALYLQKKETKAKLKSIKNLNNAISHSDNDEFEDEEDEFEDDDLEDEDYFV